MTSALSRFRCTVDGAVTLAGLREAPLPLRLRAGPAERSVYRDLYLDTPDGSLGGRGATVRLRIDLADRRILALIMGPSERWEAAVPEVDVRRALEGDSEPARRLRALVDPLHLRPLLEIETERWTRSAASGWFRRRPRFVFRYDANTVRHEGLFRTFEEIQVLRVAPGGPRLEAVAGALEARHGLRLVTTTKPERAAGLIRTLAAEATARLVASQRAVTLLALEDDGVAFLRDDDGLTLPVARGSGEEACRHLLRHLFGSGVGELTLLGHTNGTDDRPALEVWVARKLRTDDHHDAPRPPLAWLPLDEALRRAGSDLRSPETLGALALAARLGLNAARPALVPSAPAAAAAAAEPRRSRPPRAAARAETDQPPDRFLNVELAQLAFIERVLDLGVDPAEPTAERLRYLAIVASNLDEFFSVRVGALRAMAAEGDGRRSLDGLSPAEQLDAIAARVPRLLERLQRGAGEALAAVAEKRGWRIRRWEELAPAEREAITGHFRNELLALLTPRAVTMSPGHPFPVMPHLTLAFAVLVQDVRTGPVHFAYLPIPARFPRFLPVPGSSDLIPIESVVRANLAALYPERPVADAWLFRVTRGADLDMNEEEAGDLLQAIEEEVGRRPLNAVARVEVQQGMPAAVRDLLQRELRFERGLAAGMAEAQWYSIDGLLDLTCLRDLAGRLPPEDQFPPAVPRDPFVDLPSVLDGIDAADRLVHHPFDRFDRTVERFIREAAEDRTVASLKMILYRIGEQSPLVDALAAAARAGKEVAVFVELKARFDEARNVEWVRRLEEAGAQVIYGLVGLKTHAKVALVIRQTATGLRRYLHVATGNYNGVTARFYTDLGLFTTDSDLTADAVDLFNQLTGSSAAPSGAARRLLVSPHGTLPGLLRLIDGEIGHAAAGRPGLIRAQVNGLEDPEIIAAFYRAAVAGVRIDLVVRGLCLLRPGVPGLSERIRVRSVLGRYLEHQRIFHFANGGADRYYIGSADLRPRNLRRRVEVLAPVDRPDLAARLGRLLDALLEEPLGWDLAPDGGYHRRVPSPRAPHLHERLMAETWPDASRIR